MSRLITLSFPATNATLFASNISGGGAVSLLPLIYPLVFPGFERELTLSSTSNNSLITFTIVGTDQYGNSIEENLGGPNNNTVTSVNQYNTITEIYTNGPYVNLNVGSGPVGTSQWAKVNTFNAYPAITISAEVTGTINYSVTQTIDALEYSKNISSNIGAGSTPSYFVNSSPVTYPVSASLTSATTNQLYTVFTPLTALQVAVNSSTGGTLMFNILQQGID